MFFLALSDAALTSSQDSVETLHGNLSLSPHAVLSTLVSAWMPAPSTRAVTSLYYSVPDIFLLGWAHTSSISDLLPELVCSSPSTKVHDRMSFVKCVTEAASSQYLYLLCLFFTCNSNGRSPALWRLCLWMLIGTFSCLFSHVCLLDIGTPRTGPSCCSTIFCLPTVSLAV